VQLLRCREVLSTGEWPEHPLFDPLGIEPLDLRWCRLSLLDLVDPRRHQSVSGYQHRHRPAQLVDMLQNVTPANGEATDLGRLVCNEVAGVLCPCQSGQVLGAHERQDYQTLNRAPERLELERIDQLQTREDVACVIEVFQGWGANG
jgi:hypothetical protein